MNAKLGKRDTALSLLCDAGAPRVFTPTTLNAWLETREAGLARKVLLAAMQRWKALGLVKQVARGIYLNGRITPLPTLDEAAPWLRRGAVISLQRVLGQAGVLNNPTERITCVLPLQVSRAVGAVRSDLGLFTFSGMRGDLVPDGKEAWSRDALEPYAHVPTATPEKALLDWLYLARESQKWALPPRHDIDFGEMDLVRLQRLAAHMGLERDLGAFLGSAPVAAPAQRVGGRRPG